MEELIKKTSYEKFKEKNNDKIKNKIECDVCRFKYTYYSKYNHLKSQKHLNALRLIEEFDKNQKYPD